MRLMVTGGTGQVGRALARVASTEHVVIALSSQDLDVTNFAAVQHAVSTWRPDYIIHAGAMTDVDGCEENSELAIQINGTGTQFVAAIAHRYEIPLVYISTNFIFDGEAKRPYHEFDTAKPISVYGQSKLAGERAVRALAPRHYVVRTSMVYDETGRNFVNSMIRLAEQHRELRIVNDQFGNPTYALDLAAALLRLVTTGAFGTYHFTNTGVTSWYGWASAIFDERGLDIAVTPIPASEFPRAATPPANGAMENRNGTLIGITLPDWRDALRRCLATRQRNS